MPCDSSQGMGDAYREDPVARRQMEAMKTELDSVTRMLCALLTAIDPRVLDTLPTDVREWYRKHREYDRSQGKI